MQEIRKAVLALALVLLSVHHLATGAYYLAFPQSPGKVTDLRQRLIESRYLADRTWPQSQHFQDQAAELPELAPLAIGADPTNRHGVLLFSGLPPWTYAMHLVLYPPIRLSVARVWILVLDVLALGGLLFAAAVELRTAGPSSRMMGILSITAIGALDSCLTQGQNAIVVTAGIAAVLVALEADATPGRDLLAGLGMAVAFIKPTIGGPFALPVLLARRPLVVATGAAIALAAWMGSSAWTGVPMMVQWRQFDLASLQAIPGAANPVLLGVMHLTGSAALARNLLIGVGALLAIAGTLRFQRDYLASFAWLAFISRVWTYHGVYDDVMMAFLILALCERYFRRLSWRSGLLWLLCGASLWLPFSLYMTPMMQRLQMAMWAIAACALWMDGDSRRQSSVV